MRVVVALGGNALLKRGEPLDAATQRANARVAARSIAEVISAGHDVIVTHGNGPQVGLLSLQSAAYGGGVGDPLDVLGAETEGMIGYLIEQEIGNALPDGRLVATLLTQIEIDPADPAFENPTKPVGPFYEKAQSEALQATRGWRFSGDGGKFRRVVASPRPLRILEIEVISLLVAHGVTVICAGGGGIPVRRHTDGSHSGVEAVIDKDRASALLATQLKADALLMLTDVPGVYLDWDGDRRKRLARSTPSELKAHRFAAGSMGPKVEAAIEFVEAGGRAAGIGPLGDALDILNHHAGTIVAV